MDDIRAALAYILSLCEEHAPCDPGFEHPAAAIRKRLEGEPEKAPPGFWSVDEEDDYWR